MTTQKYAVLRNNTAGFSEFDRLQKTNQDLKEKIDHAINIPQQSTARHNVKATTTTEIPKVEENSEEPKSKEFKDEQEQIDNLTKQLEQVQDENKKLQNDKYGKRWLYIKRQQDVPEKHNKYPE